MVETLLRSIPDVDVKLDDFDFVKEYPSYNVKDFMTKIFGVKNLTTVSSTDYQNSIKGVGNPAAKKDSSKQPAKYLIKGDLGSNGYKIKKSFGGVDYGDGGSVAVVSAKDPSLILLHNAMILRPWVWLTDTTLYDFATIPISKGKNEKRGSGHVFTNGGFSDGKKTFTWNATKMSFSPIELNSFAERGTGIRGKTEIRRLPQKPELNFVSPDVDALSDVFLGLSTGTPLTAANVSTLESANNTIYKPMGRDIRTSVASTFTMSKNQPFFIRTKMSEMSEAQLGWARTDEFGKKEWSQFYPNGKNLKTGLEITWGAGSWGGPASKDSDTFKLVVSADGANNISLYKKTEDEWKMVGQPKSLPMSGKEASSDGYIEFTVYPMGRDIIISTGVPSTQGTLEGKYIRFSFNRFVNIQPDKLFVYFYGGETLFTFNPIVHVDEGILLSPPASVMFDPDESGSEEGRYYLKVDYEGKFKIDHAGAVSDDSEIELPIPTEEDDGSSGIGTTSKDKGGTKSKKTKKEPFFGYWEGHVRLRKQVIRESTDTDDEDEKLFYDKSKKAAGKSQFKYKLTLSSKGTDESIKKKWSGGDPDKYPHSARIYSPIIFLVELHVDPPLVKVNMSPSPQIESGDVVKVNVRQSVQEITADVTLWNRNDCDDRRFSGAGKGKFTYNFDGRGGGNFVGVKPITVVGGILGDFDPPPSSGVHNSDAVNVTAYQPYQFKGYVSDRTYTRPSTSESYVNLSCRDISAKAKETMAVNLPIFDGWGHMAAFYFLCKEAGYKDDQIMFYQDNRNPADHITIKDMIKAGGGDTDTRQGGCFAGHVPKFPKSIGPASRVVSLPPSTIFAVLPLNAFREQPAYMFSMGTYLWDCMEQIRQFSGWFLYPNHFGNLVYGPPEAVLGIKNSMKGSAPKASSGAPKGTSFSYSKPPTGDAPKAGSGGNPSTDMAFFEVSGGTGGGSVDPKAYNQYQKHLDVPIGTDHIRNAVMAQSMVQAAEDPTNPVRYMPITVVEKQQGWPRNIDDPSYVPWLKWLVARSPYWNDLARLQKNTKQRLLRGIQPRLTPAFGAWGKSRLYPYDIVLLHEQEANETGVDGVQFVTQQVTKNFDGEKKNFTMEVATEYINFSTFEWSPHDNQGVAASRGAS